MNRRSFLKSAALAVVAVPVVGLSVVPVAKVVPVEYHVTWKGVYRSGQYSTPVFKDAEAFFDDLIRENKQTSGMGYLSIELTSNDDKLFLWTYSHQ